MLALRDLTFHTVAMSKPKCYVASPSGFAESTLFWYQEQLLPMLDRYVEVLDPWSVDVRHVLQAAPAERPKLWLDLGEHHLDTVAGADMVVAILDQEPPDTGTVVEAAWAAAHRIPVIGYRNDLRTSGEEGLPYNLMLGAAIRRGGGLAVANLVELERELQQRTRV